MRYHQALFVAAWLPSTLASLPYIPTSLLRQPSNLSTVFLFEPNSDATNASLLALDISRSLTSNYAATTVSASLPFLSGSEGQNNTSFTPFIDDEGNLYVMAGDCTQGANGTSLWAMKATPDVSKSSWTRADLSASGFDATTSAGGVNYLAPGFTFTSLRNNTPALYSLGGMCPNASVTTLTSDNWQASANYSSSLLAATPQGPLSSSSFASVSMNQDIFTLSTLSSRNGPIPEAGFSATKLQASYSGSNMSTVQQNVVFVGGQTAQAFINMSQVALLSLPEQSWSFLPIDNPSSPSGELLKRDADTIEPRSGHTAVLSEDGSKIVVYGGWVGDINTPALPQLAVLEVGSGFGGSNSNWRWAVPSTSGSQPSGNGLYGHGATMLPGNVMMIAGGNVISGQGSKVKRTSASQAYFFNLTSNSWANNYTNTRSETSSGTTSEDHRGRTIGLGVGLGLGIPLFFILLFLLFCCIRNRVRKDRQRQRVLDRAFSSQDYNQNIASADTGYDPGRVMAEGNIDENPYPWASEPAIRPSSEMQEVGWRNMRSSEAERTGLLVDIPSPTRGLRRSMHVRSGSYHDEIRRNRASTGIHVIDERDEFEHGGGDLGTLRGQVPDEGPFAGSPTSPGSRPTSSQVPRVTTGAPTLDPFADPLGSHPIQFSNSPALTPSPNEDREREDHGWIDDWEALYERVSTSVAQSSSALPAVVAPAPTRLSPERAAQEQGQSGRGVSPNISDRTDSNLSEKSMHSAVSNLSEQSSSRNSVRRNVSQRSGNLFSVRRSGATRGSPNRTSMPANGTVASAIAAIEGTPPGHSPSSGTRRQHHSQSASVDSTTGLQAANVRQPSFGTLQAESQALLGGRSAATPATYLGPSGAIEGETVEWINEADEDDEFPQRPQRRSRGLMGSMRSVLSRGRETAAAAAGRRTSSSSPTNMTVPPTSPTAATFSSGSPTRASTGTPFSLLRMANPTPTNAEFEHGSSTSSTPLRPMAPAYMMGGTRHNRTASAGSAPWRRRQSGARDWDWRQSEQQQQQQQLAQQTQMAGEQRPTGQPRARHHGSTSGSGSGSGNSASAHTMPEGGVTRDDASDWDVEGAVERRCVQVMFTVPRERLRVVNAADGEDGDSVTAATPPPPPEEDQGVASGHREDIELGHEERDTAGVGVRGGELNVAGTAAFGTDEDKNQPLNLRPIPASGGAGSVEVARRNSRFRPGRGSPGLW